jgi:hypothetical protein
MFFLTGGLVDGGKTRNRCDLDNGWDHGLDNDLENDLDNDLANREGGPLFGSIKPIYNGAAQLVEGTRWPPR